MILSCPSCATGFQIDDNHIGPDGRMVRCSVCKHTWRAEKVAEPAEPAEPIELKVAVKPKVETTEDLKEVKAKKLPKKYREFVEDQKRQKAMAAQAYVWAALAGCMILALALAYVFRVDVVRTAPALAGAYESIGLKVNGTNLEFDSYSAESNFKGGRFVVTVRAKIKNLSSRPMPVPPVRAKLFDATLAEFDAQTMSSEGLVIGPKATRTMVFDVKDPRNLTASIGLDFDLEALKRQEQGRKPSHVALSDGHKSNDPEAGTPVAQAASEHTATESQANTSEPEAVHDMAQNEHITATEPAMRDTLSAEHIEAPAQTGHSTDSAPVGHTQDHTIRQAH